MDKRAFVILSVLLIATAAASPGTVADYTIKTELEYPDETYFDVEGPEFEDDKPGEELRTGGALLSNASVYTVNVTLKRGDSSTTERSSVTFPYQKFNWSIGTWYRSSQGFRFFDVSYGGEKILFDYRLPWVKVGETKYILTSRISTDGPDLTIYDRSQVFKVWVEYYIDAEDVYVEVYAYFSANGEFDPWALVTSAVDKDLVIGQRFDFDLDGAGDDNAMFYTATGWDLVEKEDDHPDAGNPEENSLQWSLFDSDTEGMGPVIDQRVDIIPYHVDDSSLYVLRYHGSEMTGYPSAYDNNEATGLYSTTTYDPYIGYDLVAWYVSDYADVQSCNPGPWIQVEV